MLMMRAVRTHAYGDPSVLRVDEVPVPTPGPRDLLIAVKASAVNPIDYKLRKGLQQAVVPLRFPAILGMDISGVVVGMGAGVTRFALGDEIVASPTHKRMGGYAEKLVVDEREAAKKPASISHVEAASLPLVGLTAWDALVRHGHLRRGERVLVQAGSGGVGTIAIQLAKHIGAEVLTTASARNEALVRDLGADVFIDYDAQSYEEVAAGCDLVLDALGDEHLERALDTVRPGGRIITITPGVPTLVGRYGPALGILAVGLRIVAFAAKARARKGVSFRPVTRVADGETLGVLMALAGRGAIRPVIDTVLPLEDAAEAHRLLEAGHRRGKVVLEVR